MSERGGKDGIRIPRMNANARDMARIFKADVLPGLARIVRFPHPFAMGDIPADGLLAAADINYVGVRFTDGHRADRPAKGLVGDVLPACAAVGCPPNASTGAAEIEEKRLAGDSRDCRRTSAAKRADQPITERTEERLVAGLYCVLVRRCDSSAGQIQEQTSGKCHRREVANQAAACKHLHSPMMRVDR